MKKDFIISENHIVLDMREVCSMFFNPMRDTKPEPGDDINIKFKNNNVDLCFKASPGNIAMFHEYIIWAKLQG